MKTRTTELWGSDETHAPITNNIDWMYPDIYAPTERASIVLNLLHVRAAYPIRISYEGERDGWVIQQASTFSWDADDKKCDMDWQEVAFVQAWAREKKAEG